MKVSGEGENPSTPGKTSQSREENKQMQPTYDTESENWIRATLVGGVCSHHCSLKRFESF